MPIFAALGDGTIDRGGYIRLLRRLYGFHMPAEAGISAGLASEAFGVTGARWQRSDLLRRDLIFMGETVLGAARIPEFADGTPMVTPARAMGWLYVLEGSTLGGRLLARHLDHILSKSNAHGRLFLLAGADPHHIGWREMCDAIDRCGEDPERRTEMISSAIEAFACFETWFREGWDVAADGMPVTPT